LTLQSEPIFRTDIVAGTDRPLQTYTSQKDFQKYLPQFEQMAKTFKFKGEHSMQVVNNNKSEVNVHTFVDGDTLDVNNVRVRLALVDTHERGEDGYASAKGFVKNLCLGGDAEVDIDDGQRGGDRYGREVGVVYCNGVNVNSELLKKGYAITYTDYCEVSEFANDGWAICYPTNVNASDSVAGNTTTEKKQGNCDPSYPDVCIPSPPPDLDCSDVSEKNFKVKGSDPHRFDNDNDGNACES